MSSPTSPQIRLQINAAIEHLHAGRVADAELGLRQVLEQHVDQGDALHLLGYLAAKTGRLDEGVELIRKAISIDPSQAIFHDNLGLLLVGQQQNEEAIESFRNAVAIAPDFVSALANLGMLLGVVGKFEEAVEAYHRALAAQPGNPDLQFSLGNTFLQQATSLQQTTTSSAELIAAALESAIDWYRKVLATKPDLLDALNNLGHALVLLGHTDEAIEAWQRAVAVHPHFHAYYNLGRALHERHRFDEAIVALTACIDLDATSADAFNNLGNALRDAGQVDQAIAAFDRAIALQSNHPIAESNRLYTLCYQPNRSAESILTEHAKWAQRITPLIQPRRIDRKPPWRLRIGYVSPNFWGHCQALFTVPLFRHHDHRELEILCYSDSRSRDAVTDSLRKSSDGWRSIVGMSDAQVAEQLRKDRIDVLVDLTLHMAHNRASLFAHRSAPLQITWLGYPGTTGLSTIDYRITDPHLDPPGEGDASYAEKSFRLPHTFWCFDPEATELVNVPKVNSLPVSSNGKLTFGCLNNFCKLNQPLLELWAKVLDAVPDSRMLVLAPKGSQRTWVSDALKGRADFVDRSSRESYLEYYHRIDIGLDTLPYNGHTTSLDSFWMGVPVVTLVGNTVVGRAGLSQLTNLKLGELAAHTPDGFVQCAAALAADIPRLAELRSGLRDRMRSSPLMDAPLFARDLEAAYRAMLETQLSR